MIKVIVNGACGRMGSTVVDAVMKDSELKLVGAVDIVGGMDAGDKAGCGKTGVIVSTDLEATIKETNPDVMVDFTQPSVVFNTASIAIKNHVRPVIGTTGLTDEQKAQLDALGKENNTPCFIAANFAIGAVLMMKMACEAAKYMPDVEIIELHHDNKLDAPSGTALVTAEMIKQVRESHKQGHENEKEKLAGARGAEYDGMRIHSVRLPGYVAHQEVIFGGLGQTLTIRHDSIDRTSFMPGVVLACKKIMGLNAGLTCNLRGEQAGRAAAEIKGVRPQGRIRRKAVQLPQQRVHIGVRYAPLPGVGIKIAVPTFGKTVGNMQIKSKGHTISQPFS